MGVGRKTILTKEIQEAICANVVECYYISTATEAVGINVKTTRAWIDKGRDHEKAAHPDGDPCDELCSESEVANRAFADAIKKAQATFSLNNMRSIGSHRPKTFLAGAWLQERTQPDKYGMVNRTELSVSGTVKHQHSLSIEQRKKALQAATDSLVIDTAQEDDD